MIRLTLINIFLDSAGPIQWLPKLPSQCLAGFPMSSPTSHGAAIPDLWRKHHKSAFASTRPTAGLKGFRTCLASCKILIFVELDDMLMHLDLNQARFCRLLPGPPKLRRWEENCDVLHLTRCRSILPPRKQKVSCQAILLCLQNLQCEVLGTTNWFWVYKLPLRKKRMYSFIPSDCVTGWGEAPSECEWACFVFRVLKRVLWSLPPEWIPIEYNRMDFDASTCDQTTP